MYINEIVFKKYKTLIIAIILLISAINIIMIAIYKSERTYIKITYNSENQLTNVQIKKFLNPFNEYIFIKDNTNIKWFEAIHNEYEIFNIKPLGENK